MNGLLWGRAKETVLSLLFPDGNTCHLCEQPMLSGSERWLCEVCAAELQKARLTGKEEPLFVAELLPCTVAAYRYDSVAQELLHALKYRGNPWAAAPLAEGMAAQLATLPCEELRRAEVLVPVPLHPKREKERGYNQAGELCKRLAAHTGIPCELRALARIHSSRSQVGTGREQRLHHMSGAFEVADIPSIYRKHVVLVDDVCTTGATAIACAQVLLACGAKDVTLFAACRA